MIQYIYITRVSLLPETARPSPGNMPAHRAGLPVSGSPHLTRLEQIFGFQNEAFRNYMRIGRVDGREHRFKHIQSEMGKYDHPVVQFAAGSAAVELSLLKDIFKQSSTEEALAKRKHLIDVAKDHFLQSVEGFAKLAAGGPFATSRVAISLAVIHYIATCSRRVQ
jgi:hypothetical protein